MKRTAINMFSGGAGYLLPMAINFLATPLLLRNLGPEAFGLQSLVNVILGYLMVADMGLDVPIIKFLSQYISKNEFDNRDRLLNSTLQIYALLGFVGMVVIFVAEPYLYSFFNIPGFLVDEARSVFLLTAIGFLGSITAVWGKAVFIGMQRYDIANGIYVGVNTIFSIIGVVLVYNGMGVVSYILMKVMAFYFITLTYLIYAKSILNNYKFSFGISRAIVQKIKPMIGYGVIMRISGLLFSKLDQVLIATWVGVNAVGFYTIPILLVSALVGVITGTMSFTFPRASALYSLDKKEELNELFISSTKYVSIAASFIFGFLIIIGDKFISLWIDPQAASATYVTLVILSIAYLIQTLATCITNNIVIAMNGMKYFAMYSLTRSATMMIGFFLLIKPFGIKGAAIGVLIGSSLDIAFLVWAIKRHIHIELIPFIRMSYFKPLLLALLSTLPIYFIKSYISSWSLLVLAGICYTIIFTYLGHLLSVLDVKERLLILDIIKKMMKFVKSKV